MGDQEIEEMINIVDKGAVRPELQTNILSNKNLMMEIKWHSKPDGLRKNGDGKISYSEFRVMLGAFPLLIPEDS